MPTSDALAPPTSPSMITQSGRVSLPEVWGWLREGNGLSSRRSQTPSLVTVPWRKETPAGLPGTPARLLRAPTPCNFPPQDTLGASVQGN